MKNLNYSATILIFLFFMQSIFAIANEKDNKNNLLPINEFNTKVAFKTEEANNYQIIATKANYSVIRCKKDTIKDLRSYDEIVGEEYCYFVCLENQILTIVNQSNKEMIANSFIINKDISHGKSVS
jgi:hypothetical protein